MPPHLTVTFVLPTSWSSGYRPTMTSIPDEPEIDPTDAPVTPMSPFDPTVDPEGGDAEPGGAGGE